MKKTVFIICLTICMLCSACSPGGIVPPGDLVEKLDEIDAYKDNIPTAAPIETPADSISTDTDFRGIPYGLMMDEVLAIERLEVVEMYNNAIDFEYTEVFGRPMMTAYWFNKAGVFYRGGYYMESDELEAPLMHIYDLLVEENGEPFEYNFYNYEGDKLPYETFAQGLPDVTAGNAYYFVWFDLGLIDIELFGEVSFEDGTLDEPVYDIYVVYTDYRYYDN